MSNPLNRAADALARQHGEKAIRTLADLMDNGEKDSDRIKAATEILDRGYGKPLAATIAIPVPKRMAQQLYAMSDEDLIAEIRGDAAQLDHQPPPNELTYEDALNALPSMFDIPDAGPTPGPTPGLTPAPLPHLVDPDDPLLA